MNRGSQRSQLARAYVLHQRPFRDSSLILEVFAREQGRLTLFAHGARGARSRFTTLQPFRPLLLSWSGRSEAPSLTAAERAEPVVPLPAAQLMSGFYLNELLLKLLARHDPHPALFESYETALAGLAQQSAADGPLRRFETQLLGFLGYGLNLSAEATTGEPVRAGAYYQFQPGVHGFVVAEPASPGAIAGQVLHDLAAGCVPTEEAALRQARALMRAALDHCLEGRTLASREVARTLAHWSRRERRA